MTYFLRGFHTKRTYIWEIHPHTFGVADERTQALGQDPIKRQDFKGTDVYCCGQMVAKTQ